MEQEPCWHCGGAVEQADELHSCGWLPFEKRSQQSHGESTLYCNACQMYVKPVGWEGEQVCPYHQRVCHGEEGSYLMYDEFNQDGEEW